MSGETDISNQIESIDVNDCGKENGSSSEKSSDSGIEAADTASLVYLPSSDSETSPVKSITVDQVTESFFEASAHPTDPGSAPASPVSATSCLAVEYLSSESSPEKFSLNSDTNNEDETQKPISNNYDENNLKVNNNLASSTINLNENPILNLNKSHSRSAENISVTNNKNLDKDQILSQFASQKNKVTAIQKIPDATPVPSINLDPRYSRIPKEILSQDIGNIVKNVHGIFSSVSGSLKHAYSQRTIQKPTPKLKPIPNSKVMNDIFEDEAIDNSDTGQTDLKMNTIEKIDAISSLKTDELKDDLVQAELDPKGEVIKLQIETLERLLFEQRKENSTLRERVKQQVDEMQEKDQIFKDLEMKLDLMSKRVDQAEREKDAAVMRYASVECAAIEAKRAADTASKAEKQAQAEVELLNNKLKSAHGEKQRIIQLYDDKCHELSNTERELAKVRDDIKELEGRLKWTQSKLRMEMDAYKESSERVEKLSQQVSELEAAKDAAATNSTDAVKARQLESELKECRATLILCRHEREELDKRLAALTLQLDTCSADRDQTRTALTQANIEIEQLKIENLRLEEEAAELAALRAKAALADTLSAQLQRETKRASEAEEQLSVERARAETCARREASALAHAASVTATHVQQRALEQHHLSKAQALSADNASLRERVTSLEEECSRLQTSLTEETERRNRENRVLARKVAELTEEVTELNKKLEWEKGENGVLKKKHASAIKELNRELQRALKRCEQLEAKLPPPDATSTRTGSITSLSSSESAPQEERLQNGHTDTLPDIQIKVPSIFDKLFAKAREPDRQALIERIVSLQRAAARRAERCDFLEEHCKQLTDELRNKSRLLRHMLCSMPAGAVASQDRDINKKEIARLGGGAMAAVWGGDPNGMTLDLSLEMNKRLQAVLEDTLLKNITLKENMDTLGAEISRLKEQKNSDK